MSSMLIVGYGNSSRRDDGVALHIMQRLRRRLGLPPSELDDGSSDASGDLAMIYVHQLGPELAETLSQHDLVVFVDAHVEGANWQPVHWQEIIPAFRSSMVSHRLTPDVLLALCQTLFGHAPKAYMLSVLGHDFDFGDELSAETSALAEEAVSRLVNLVPSENVTV
jgi:hydrogenase maturation protease